ncbi:MAG: glycosyltransferase family 9 protein [Verrucomicrobia bacterium]|nr:glycosyltransferase family 9 protein [Verrucomicrobiota bacterium]
MRILVLRGGALGDLVVTLPALALLRRRWPAARLELAGNPVAGRLALDARLADVLHSQHEGRWAALYGSTPLPPDFRTWLAGFDLVVTYWPDPTGELARHFPLHAGQRLVQGGAHPTWGPAAAFYCAPLAGLGLQPETLVCRLREPAVRSPVIALHPGSGSPRKNWPLDRWAALARWLRDVRQREVVVLAGEAEPTAGLDEIGPVRRELPLPQVLDLLATCRLFIGHDSGVSHLAAAAATPGLLLFGPTDPAIWAPPTPALRVIRRGLRLDQISLRDVQAQVDALLADQS